MGISDRLSQFLIELQNEELVKKYIYNDTWLSGSSTSVYPIAVSQYEIVIQWKSSRRIFDKFIDRMAAKYKDLILYGYFWKSDGSCPSTITFKLKEEF